MVVWNKACCVDPKYISVLPLAFWIKKSNTNLRYETSVLKSGRVHRGLAGTDTAANIIRLC